MTMNGALAIDIHGQVVGRHDRRQPVLGQRRPENALEVARFGGLDTGEEPSPFEVVGARARSTGCATTSPTTARTAAGPPILLVPPMMLGADVYDVSPVGERGAGPARARRRPVGGRLRGTRAARRAASSARSPTTCSPCRDAVDHRARSTRAATCTSAATPRAGCSATRPPPTAAARGWRSVITFGSPVDTCAMRMPFGIPEEVAVRGVGFARGPGAARARGARRGRAAPASGCSTR